MNVQFIRSNGFYKSLQQKFSNNKSLKNVRVRRGF